ncbi:putative bifunctional diguanylate cyclase/phosphodiesterase [Pseudomonas benzenivorans]|uniref:EAL domain-containing protein n=1 Tax=Pseudomonas benzenivorans TaxID=556533 RepID=A0ABY5H832_9PSED|nr:EAL domain-containing protein [Pseudomonas benzenivorans]UTW08461.1 EAL domain-containing protein [Pseudomonas benzenivorans]
MDEVNELTTLLEQECESEERLCVLVVDDDELIRMHMQLSLTHEGLEITEACDGAQALALGQQRTFDIVLMDVRMPGMDGFTACKKFKQLPAQRQTPVVMLTGMEDLDSINRATEAGATDYVTKPLSARVLAKRLRHIVQAQRDQAALEQERASQAALLHAIPDCILRFDAGGILQAAKIPERMPQLLNGRLRLGRPIHEVFAGVAQFDPCQALQMALEGDTLPLQLNGSDDSVFEVRFAASGSNDVICMLRDTTNQARQQRHIERLSLIDSLTGLPNRACFLQVAQRHLDATMDNALCLLQLSFDSYPGIRNNVGAKIADRLMKTIADQLLAALDGSQQYGEHRPKRLPFIARTSDADFHVLLNDAVGHLELKRVMARVGAAFEQPIQVDKYEFRLPLYSGAAIQGAGQGNVEQLFNMSGLAAHKASQLRSRETLLYSPELEQQSQRALYLEAALRRAISHGELELLYQPKVSAISGRLMGVEALARWQDPELGAISPAEFIPLAEDTGLILPLGDLVLEKACQQSRRWQLDGHGEIPIAVNVSAHQFNQRNIEQRLFRLLERMHVAPSAIELEITESVLIEQQHVLATLQRMRERGVKIAIDDFGTGYSSLSMLKTFPIDILKIDRAFVMDITDATRAHSIVDAIIALGHSLDLVLVAEGIETEAQLRYLRERNCQLIQGYLTGRPMSASDIQAHYLD